MKRHKMNRLSRYRLEKFCREHGIDLMEIDLTLSEGEVMEHLNELVLKDVEDLEAEAKSLEEYYDSCSLEDFYGFSIVMMHKYKLWFLQNYLK